MGYLRSYLSFSSVIFLPGVAAAFLIIGSPVNSAFAQSAQSCEQLYTFRDTQLAEQWDVAAERYKLSAENLIEYGRRKADLLDETKWVTSDSFEFLSMMAAGTKLLADLINDTVSIAVPGKSALTKGASVTANTVFNGLKETVRVHDLARDLGAKSVAKEVLNNINPVTQSVNAVWNFADNLKTIVELAENQNEIKRMVRDQLRPMERAVADYLASLRESQARIAYINAFKEGIDLYCQKEADAGFAGRWAGKVNNHNSGFQINITGGQITGHYTQNQEAPLLIEDANLSDKILRFKNHYDNWACSGKCTIEWTLNLISEKTIQGTWRNGPMSGPFTMQRK